MMASVAVIAMAAVMPAVAAIVIETATTIGTIETVIAIASFAAARRRHRAVVIICVTIIITVIHATRVIRVMCVMCVVTVVMVAMHVCHRLHTRLRQPVVVAVDRARVHLTVAACVTSARPLLEAHRHRVVRVRQPVVHVRDHLAARLARRRVHRVHMTSATRHRHLPAGRLVSVSLPAYQRH